MDAVNLYSYNKAPPFGPNNERYAKKWNPFKKAKLLINDTIQFHKE